jgi:hypothetical protein
VLYQLSYMGAQSIISPKPNRQNDKKPFPSIFFENPRSYRLRSFYFTALTGPKVFRQTLSCQQLFLFFSTSLKTSFLTEIETLEIMSKDVQNWLLVSDI